MTPFRSGDRNSIAGAALFLLTLAVPRTAAAPGGLRGIVVDGESHAPVEQAVVRVVERDTVCLTDERGVFAFSGLTEGTYTLEAGRLGYRRTTINVAVEPGHREENVYIHLFPLPIRHAGIVVTGRHPDTKVDDLFGSRQVVEGMDLQRDLGFTLAATLRNETGLAIRSMGPAPARPVIRGLGGDRILITEDGAKTNDLSATSPDHAVTVEPFTVDRIEVLRGPRVLLYGPAAIGGVVNIVRDEVPRTIPGALSGWAGLFGESGNSGVLGSAVALVPLRPFVVRGEYSAKRSGDVRTPSGRLKNSDARTGNHGFGFSYAGGSGFAGAAIREYRTDYGIPGGFVGAHPRGVDISIFRRQITARAASPWERGFLREIEVEAGRTYYRHKEFEYGGLIGAEFQTTNYSGRAEIRHDRLGPFDGGVWGVSLDARDFLAGGFVFTPATRSFAGAAFLLESLTSGDLDFQLAGRIGYDRLTPRKDDPEARIGPIRSRSFVTFALSSSLLYRFSGALSAGGTLSRSSRVPTIEELYSEGPHLAAYSYEVGNPGLEDERGVGLEGFLYYKAAEASAALTLFRNSLSSYIVTRNTGRMNYTTLLPVYAASGVSAVLQGIETQLEWRPVPEVSLSASCSWTHGEITDGDTPLPAVPPLKGLLEIRYSAPLFAAGVSLEAAAAQSRVDAYEQPTTGYAVAGVFAQYTLLHGPLIHTLSATLDNIFDREYRNHLSRVRSIMPEAGRNLRVTYRVAF